MKSLFATSRSRSWLEATITARAMARSRWVPDLASSAGARLTVRWLGGNRRLEFLMALRTRSLASVRAREARPIILKMGRHILFPILVVLSIAILEELEIGIIEKRLLKELLMQMD